MNNKGTKIFRGYIFLGILVMGLIYHSRYSFCYTDESLYSALVHRLWMGERLITDEWHPVQFYVPILLPFYAAFRVINKTSDGIILYFRILYILFNAFVSIYLFKVLSRKFPLLPSVITATFLLLYSRANINGPSYYNLCILFFVLSTILIYQGLNNYEHEKMYALAAGIIISGAVLCNPWVAVFIVPLIGIFLWRHGKTYMFLHYFIGIVISAILYLSFLLYNNNVDMIIKCIQYVLNDSEHYVTFFEKMRIFIQNNFRSNAVAIIGVVLSFFYCEKRKLIIKHSKLIPIIWLIYFLIGGFVLFGDDFINGSTSVCYIVTYSFTIYILPVMLLFIIKKEMKLITLFYVSGILMAVAFMAASDTGIDAMTVGFCISSMAGVLALSRFYERYLVSISLQRYDERLIKAVFNGLVGIIVIGMLLLFAGHRFLGIYRDAELNKCNTPIMDGPAKYLYTTEEHEYQYTSILRTAKEFVPISREQSVLISNICPWLYLCFDCKIGGYTVWSVSMDNPFQMEYYNLFPEKKADIIFLLEEEVGGYETAVFNNHTSYNKFNKNNLNCEFYEQVIAEYELIKETEFLKVFVQTVNEY